ncbi:NAD(P)-dependent alcohol dehydrogenase [uncultured Microbulbifer sp.]|uniref:NAD(P)-dependent alcohol dehydrogenase n=1 Tax=uncultured Microbulbifer sp. TaxID=348147 RepID=UPI0026236CCC|nr:NAD(P)-dependent alcohol dehydrogenase [uncultured Microbulbifer sp.]
MTGTHRVGNEFTAAVAREPGSPFVLEQVRQTKLLESEVLVKIVATGICQTDMIARDQDYLVPHPIVLGHEGAGVVEAVGDSVLKVTPGDHVVLTFLSCSSCRECISGHPACCENFRDRSFSAHRIAGSHALADQQGGTLNDRFFGQSSFGEYAVANGQNVVKVRKDAPLALLGPLGCGIQTCAGTALNSLKVSPDSSFVAFGAVAVGLAAMMAASAAGAITIIAVDILPSRLKPAMEVGPTHTIDSTQGKVAEQIRAITGKGVEFALDATGIPTVINTMIDCLRSRGEGAIIGLSKPGERLTLDLLNQCIRRGVVEGDSLPDQLIPTMIDLYMAGRFPFDKLIKFYDFSQINQAAEDSEKGLTLKPVVRFS